MFEILEPIAVIAGAFVFAHFALKWTMGRSLLDVMVEDIDRPRDQTQREIRAARDARRDALEEAARIVAPRGPEPDPKIDDINSWEKWRERERLSNIIRARIDGV